MFLFSLLSAFWSLKVVAEKTCTMPPPPRNLRSTGTTSKTKPAAKKKGTSKKAQPRRRKPVQQTTEQPRETSVVVSAADTCDQGTNKDDDSSVGTSNGEYSHECAPIKYSTDHCCAIFT